MYKSTGARSSWYNTGICRKTQRIALFLQRRVQRAEIAVGPLCIQAGYKNSRRWSAGHIHFARRNSSVVFVGSNFITVAASACHAETRQCLPVWHAGSASCVRVNHRRVRGLRIRGAPRLRQHAARFVPSGRMSYQLEPQLGCEISSAAFFWHHAAQIHSCLRASIFGAVFLPFAPKGKHIGCRVPQIVGTCALRRSGDDMRSALRAGHRGPRQTSLSARVLSRLHAVFAR